MVLECKRRIRVWHMSRWDAEHKRGEVNVVQEKEWVEGQGQNYGWNTNVSSYSIAGK